MRRRPEEAQRAFDEQMKSSGTPGSVPGNSIKQFKLIRCYYYCFGMYFLSMLRLIMCYLGYHLQNTESVSNIS